MKKIDNFSNILLLTKELGLSKIELRIYLKLLEIGQSSMSHVASLLKIPRTTAFENTEKLIRKGLVSRTFEKSKKRIVAEDPNKIEMLLKNKELVLKSQQKKLVDIRNNLPDLINLVQNSVPQANSLKNVSLRYFEGKKEVFSVYQESMKADNYYSFADLSRYYKIYPDTMDLWEKALNKNPKREVWDILVYSPLSVEVARTEYDRYHVRILPESSNPSDFDFADYIIFDNKLAIIQLDEENTTATVIESENISKSLIALHRTMWQLLPRTKKG